MKKIFFLSALTLVAFAGRSQFVTDYLKAADNYFAKQDYASAAEYYEKFLDGGKAKGNEFKPYAPQNGSQKKSTALTSRETALYRLAESYRMLNYPAKAEPRYQQVIETNKAAFPLAQYHYASQQRALAKYSEAEQNFKTFIAEYSTTDNYRANAERELKNLQFIQQQLSKKDLKYYTVNKAPAELNTTGASYAPAWLNANTLLFTSTRPVDSSAKNKQYTNRVFQAVYSGGQLSDIVQASLPQDKEVQQGVVTITPDGNMLFVTRWSIQGQKKSSALYSSSKNSDGWSAPQKLGEHINTTGYSTQQPFVTPDGKYLVFSSDRPGGQGGFDLWYAELKNGDIGTPMNMGTTINTQYDEQAPFYHNDSKSLIFSTNGRVGMGGYDFFESKGYFGSWTEPVNLGYPVNSIKDDIYMVSRGTAKNILEDVMLSSDRDAACCLELFYLKKIRPLKQISGTVVSCDPSKPLIASKVIVRDTVNNKTLHTVTTGSDGTYSFTLEDHLAVKISAEAEGYIPGSVHVPVPSDIELERYAYPNLCLMPEPPKVNETFVVENVYYDFNEAALKSESFPALDEIVRMLNYYPNMVIELSAHTDSKGSDSYNLKLSEARARSVVDYLVSKGISADRLVAKGYGESRPIAENTINGKDNPEGREKNRRTEFKVLKND